MTVLSVDRSNYCWSSAAQSFLASRLVGIYDQGSCPLLDVYVFRSVASSARRKGVALSVYWSVGLTAKLLLALPSRVIHGYV
jgi:hypothetical protein